MIEATSPDSFFGLGVKLNWVETEAVSLLINLDLWCEQSILAT
jgi:hypothetical protein